MHETSGKNLARKLEKNTETRPTRGIRQDKIPQNNFAPVKLHTTFTKTGKNLFSQIRERQSENSDNGTRRRNFNTRPVHYSAENNENCYSLSKALDTHSWESFGLSAIRISPQDNRRGRRMFKANISNLVRPIRETGRLGFAVTRSRMGD